MSEFTCRPATCDDAAAVAHVHRHSRADYYGTTADEHDDRDAMWTNLLRQAGRTTHVAATADGVVGFASWHRTEDGDVALSALYVLPESFGRGIGSQLHERYDAERGHHGGVLEVWSGNRRALDFYARRGWRPTAGTRPGPDDVDFVTYRRSPGP